MPEYRIPIAKERTADSGLSPYLFPRSIRVFMGKDIPYEMDVYYPRNRTSRLKDVVELHLISSKHAIDRLTDRWAYYG